MLVEGGRGSVILRGRRWVENGGVFIWVVEVVENDAVWFVGFGGSDEDGREGEFWEPGEFCSGEE